MARKPSAAEIRRRKEEETRAAEAAHRKKMLFYTRIGFVVTVVAILVSILIAWVNSGDEPTVVNNNTTINEALSDSKSSIARTIVACPSPEPGPSVKTSVQTLVRMSDSDECFAAEARTDRPGVNVTVAIYYKNRTGAVARDVIVGLNLPDNVQSIPNSTKIFNGNHPDGLEASTDKLTSGGINIGNYASPSDGVVTTEIAINHHRQFAKCGPHILWAAGIARVPGDEKEIYDEAGIYVQIPCRSS